jgi:hypothetical protein
MGDKKQIWTWRVWIDETAVWNEGMVEDVVRTVLSAARAEMEAAIRAEEREKWTGLLRDALRALDPSSESFSEQRRLRIQVADRIDRALTEAGK